MITVYTSITTLTILKTHTHTVSTFKLDIDAGGEADSGVQGLKSCVTQVNFKSLRKKSSTVNHTSVSILT